MATTRTAVAAHAVIAQQLANSFLSATRASHGERTFAVLQLAIAGERFCHRCGTDFTRESDPQIVPVGGRLLHATCADEIFAPAVAAFATARGRAAA